MGRLAPRSEGVKKAEPFLGGRRFAPIPGMRRKFLVSSPGIVCHCESIMRWFRCALAFAVVTCLAGAALAAEFRLVTGDVYKGELSAADKDGLVVRLESGDYSPRIDWAKLSDETLRDLADNAKARRFVEPFIEPPAETVAIQQAKEIKVHQPARLERPEAKKGLIPALTTPHGLSLLGLLFLANLYGAYEVARFKWRPPALVCGLSAVFPVFGPFIFLVLPRNVPVELENATEAAVQQTHLAVGSQSAPAGGAPTGGAAAALGISKASAGHGAAQEGLPRVFKRGETTFNRRFFETQFQNFFRVVASEADKDLVIDVSAGKKSVVATRVSRISAGEIHFKTATGQEVGVPFAEMSEVKLRHKDAA